MQTTARITRKWPACSGEAAARAAGLNRFGFDAVTVAAGDICGKCGKVRVCDGLELVGALAGRRFRYFGKNVMKVLRMGARQTVSVK